MHARRGDRGSTRWPAFDTTQSWRLYPTLASSRPCQSVLLHPWWFCLTLSFVRFALSCKCVPVRLREWPAACPNGASLCETSPEYANARTRAAPIPSSNPDAVICLRLRALRRSVSPASPEAHGFKLGSARAGPSEERTFYRRYDRGRSGNCYRNTARSQRPGKYIQHVSAHCPDIHFPGVERLRPEPPDPADP